MTSWTQLRRDALAAERDALLDPGAQARVPYVTQALQDAPGPVVAVSDYMRAVQDQIRPFVSADFISPGHRRLGHPTLRGALRRHFLVDAESITTQTLAMLAAKARSTRMRGGSGTPLPARRPGAADAGNTEGTG